MPILPQQGAFAAVLPAGPFTLQIEWAGAIATEPGRAWAQLPQLGAGTIRVTIDAPGEGSDLTIDRALITRRARAQGRLIVDATVAPGGGSRIGWSSRDAGTSSPVRALRLLDDVKTLVTVGENDLRVTAIFDVTVVQGTTATLAVHLPDGFSLTSFTGAPNEGADVVDGRLVLNVPAGRARHQFLVALERPIVDAGSRRTVALPWLEGSQRETGDVAVEGVGALELAVAEQRPVTRIDVVELSAALTALAHEPLLAAYRYQRRAAEAVTLAFDVTRFPDAAVLAAAADRATATTLVTPEGRSLTEVSLTVRNQAQPFLRVGLPGGATLLSAEVAGAAVKPAQGADGLRIPLLRPGFRPQGPYVVSFVYLHAGPAFAEKGDASLTLARVDLPVAWLEWEMLLPDRMEASRFDGTRVPARAGADDDGDGDADGRRVWRRRISVRGPRRQAPLRGRPAGRQRAVAERAEPAEARRRRPAGAPRRPTRRPVAHLRPSAGDGRGDARDLPVQIEEIATPGEAPKKHREKHRVRHRKIFRDCLLASVVELGRTLRLEAPRRGAMVGLPRTR